MRGRIVTQDGIVSNPFKVAGPAVVEYIHVLQKVWVFLPRQGAEVSMSARSSYVVSATLHALLAWALASASELLRPEFAVRAGHSAPLISQGGPVAPPLDSRIEAEDKPIPLKPPEYPQVPVDTPPFPQAAELDDSPVESPPVPERQRLQPQRTRELAMVDLPLEKLPLQEERTPLEPLDGPIETLEPQLNVPPMPTRPDATPIVRTLPPPTAVAVIDPGPAEMPSAASNTAQGAKVDRLPRPLPTNREPVYPDELRRQRIGGRVLLQLTILPDGKVTDISIAESSGQAALDASALAAIRTWQFEPARRGGEAVAYSVRLPIQFSIRG